MVKVKEIAKLHEVKPNCRLMLRNCNIHVFCKIHEAIKKSIKPNLRAVAHRRFISKLN